MMSQNDLENHKKYWYYKARLNNDFVKIGNSAAPNDHGESMPLNERGWEDNSGTYGYGSSIMKIGDGSARLGIYIAVLATEYKLLKNSGQDLTKIKHELFCALNAVNRIDYYAESIFSVTTPNGTPTMNPNLNGFFMRDDVPPGFIKNNYKHFNYYSEHGINGAGSVDRQNDKGFTQTFTSGQDSTVSTYNGYLQDVNKGKSRSDCLDSREESQDQAYYLLMGLSLVSQLVDDVPDGGNVFGYGSGETKLKTEAVNISDRIIKHLAGSSGALGFWNIRNPANGNAFVQIGHDVKAYAYPLDNTGCFIKYGQDMPFIFFPPAPGIVNPYNQCFDYRNIYSTTTAPGVWKTLSQVDGGYTVDEQGFFHALAGMCNCIFEDIRFKNLDVQTAMNNVLNQINNVNNYYNNFIQQFLDNLPPWVSHSANWVTNVINNINTIMITITNALNAVYNNLLSQLFPSFKTNTTDNRLVHNTYFNNVAYTPVGGIGTSASHLGSDAYFGIYLREVLHPNTGVFQLPSWLQFAVPTTLAGHLAAKNDMKNILDAAPCQGNYRMYPSIPSPYWGASNRLDRIDPLWRSTWGDGNQGEYNGTDYMLLHNLYYLSEGTTNSMVDYTERKVLQNMPYGGIFSLSNKKTLGAYEFINAYNTVNSNGGADYRAGKEIALLPNFSAVQGCEFSAVISPYNCSASGSNINRMSNSNYDDFSETATQYASKPEKNQSKTEDKKDSYSDNTALNKFNSQIDSLIKNSGEKHFFTTKIEVYPNPNNGEFTIEFNLDREDNVDVIIYDIVGNEIFKQKQVSGYLNMPINLKDYAKGIYIVRFRNTSGIEFYNKVTIQ